MKKRIISLILVAVMSVLALAGCAYSYADDDMSAYATFDKEAFETALATIVLEEGDFAVAEREGRVADAIAKALAAKADTTDHKTEGTPKVNDTVYYCYYVTATIKDVEYIFLTENMKVEEASKMDNVQYGLNFIDDDVLAAIEEKLEGFEFTEESTYSQVTTGTVKNGDVVYISYTREYDKTTGTEGEVGKETQTATTHRIVIDENNPFHKALIGKDVAKTLDEINITDGDASTNGKYTKTKVEWIEKGAEAFTVVDATYDVATNKPSTLYTTTKNQDLKGVELTYHVYPAYYVETPAYTAETVINEIYGKNLTLATAATILFGADYTEGEEAEVEALLAKYKFTKDGEELSLEDFITALTTAQTKLTEADEALEKAKEDYDDALEALETAKTALDKAKTSLDEAQAAYDANATDENKTALDKATTAHTTAQGKYDAALKTFKVERTIYDGTAEDAKTPVEVAEGEYTEGEGGEKKDAKEAKTERDALVAEFITTVGEAEEGEGEAQAKGAAKILEGYEYNVTYKNLESTYNAEIKEKLASYVYDAIIENVTVSSYPKKAVKEAYNYLIENYEYCFYENKTVTGSSVSSSSDSNYKKYNGSFETFLVKYAVPTDLKVEVSNADEAYAAIEKEAQRHVAEIIAIYIVAEKYGMVASDDEYEDYLETDNMEYYVDAYGDNTVRSAYQFDKLLDFILESEEKEDGKATLVEYTNALIGDIQFVEELPEEEEDETTETE
ncbi:MAG: hypothetical protein IJ515_00840 [Clostridia bacterium]|nr:hypothetical protein [Clostridia bacterium]